MIGSMVVNHLDGNGGRGEEERISLSLSLHAYVIKNDLIQDQIANQIVNQGDNRT